MTVWFSKHIDQEEIDRFNAMREEGFICLARIDRDGFIIEPCAYGVHIEAMADYAAYLYARGERFTCYFPNGLTYEDSNMASFGFHHAVFIETAKA